MGKTLGTILSAILSIIVVCVFIVMVVFAVGVNLWFGHEEIAWLMVIIVGLSIVIGAFTPRGWRNRMKQRRAAPPPPVAQVAPAADPRPALETLKERLANGEITVEEYRRIRATLEKD